MFSLNGSLNIKNILIVNLILSLFITLILAIKIGNIKELNAYQTCRHIADSYSHALSDGSSYTYSICKKSGYFYYDEKNKKYRSKKQTTKNVFVIELDNVTYFYNFFLINNATFILKDIKTKIKRFEIENNIFEYQENAALIHIIEGGKNVRNRSLVETLSNIYTSLFKSNDFSYFFLNFINFLYLLITFFFIVPNIKKYL